MFQVYLLIRGDWVPHGDPMKTNRKALAAQLRGEGRQDGTWKIRKVA